MEFHHSFIGKETLELFLAMKFRFTKKKLCLCNWVKIKNYLKEDGILILGVPCVPYVQSLIRLRQFSGSLSPAHVNFFNRYTLQLFVEYGGWKVSKNSGFYFTNKILDFLFNFICPHFYIVAKVNKNFKYEEKRLIELSGYTKLIKVEGR